MEWSSSVPSAFGVVVRHRVVPLREPDLGIRAEVELAAEHERHDAREVRLEREPLELVHELDVLAEDFRNALRALERGHSGIVAEAFDRLDAPLDFAHGLEVLVDLHAVYVEPATWTIEWARDFYDYPVTRSN